MALTDLYLAAGRTDRARMSLAEEAAFTDRIYQMLRRTGTPHQVRAASAGRLQVRDRLTQVALLGQPAPEIEIAEWVQGQPTTLAEQRGRVVLLEFWAHWCRPCLVLFPKLRDLHARYAQRGLTILALTCSGGFPPETSPEQQAELRSRERESITQAIADRDLEFAVGIAPDGRLQRQYGAQGIPALTLVDRGGVVRFASGSGDDAELERAIAGLL
jgi:thiol-disulfide isomerase/thioredoxin